MSDDRVPHPRRGSSVSPGHRASGSSVLTPPTGIPATPLDMSIGPAPQLVPTPATPAAVGSPCRCGHSSDVHRHWRRGSDCGQCGPGACTAYRPRGGVVRRLLRAAGLRR